MFMCCMSAYANVCVYLCLALFLQLILKYFSNTPPHEFLLNSTISGYGMEAMEDVLAK